MINLEDNIKKFFKRKLEIEGILSSSNLDPKEFATLSKELSEVSQVTDLSSLINSRKNELEDLYIMLKDKSSDADLQEMAREETSESRRGDRRRYQTFDPRKDQDGQSDERTSRGFESFSKCNTQLSWKKLSQHNCCCGQIVWKDHEEEEENEECCCCRPCAEKGLGTCEKNCRQGIRGTRSSEASRGSQVNRRCRC